MATFPVPFHNYPPEIQRIVASMNDVKNLIKELEQRLGNARNEYDVLETALFNYHATIAPIRRCPAEVLLMIFKYYLEENPRIINQLLFVCRQWHNIVSNAPQLWNHVVVTFTGELDVESTSDAINRRIEMGLRRSGTMLLDLDLDFHGLLSPNDTIRGRIISNLQEVVTPEGHDHMKSWVYHSVDNSQLDWHVIPECMPYHAYSVIDALVGDIGEHMLRWRSLHLRLPDGDYDTGRETWQLLSYPTPNLIRMTLRNLHDSHLRREYDGSIIESLPDLSALKHLEMSSVPDVGCFAFGESHLESLVIHGDVKEWASSSISRFRRLRKLELVKPEDTCYSLFVHPPTEFTLRLPELRELILRGSFRYVSKVEFCVPKLQDLSIIREPPYSYALPKVQPSRLRWEPTVDWENYEEEHLISELRKLLVHYPGIEHLVTHSYCGDVVVKVVKELKASGRRPPGLDTFTFEGDDGDSVTICREKK